MTEGVPLIIPEVNADHLNGHKSGKGGIIANPNCSTIIALMAVTPIHRAAGVKRMVVSTYQVRQTIAQTGHVTSRAKLSPSEHSPDMLLVAAWQL